MSILEMSKNSQFIIQSRKIDARMKARPCAGDLSIHDELTNSFATFLVHEWGPELVADGMIAPMIAPGIPLLRKHL